MGKQRGLIVGVLVLALSVASVGVAAAGISSGTYRYQRQHCTGGAEDSDQPNHVEAGCRSAGVGVVDGDGTEALGIGTQQTADGTNVNSLTPPIVQPQTIDLSSGVGLYVQADDNLDTGEHDSSEAIHDGPSDGGGVALKTNPESAQQWFAAFINGDQPYLISHPIPYLDAGIGSCADGICESVQTEQNLAYQGGDPTHSRDVADYAGQTWDPETCAGPTDNVADCGHDGIAFWHHQSPTTYVEPGLQVYEDPNPEGSPIGPYPLPAVAITTCGIFLGGGPLQIPASPLTNSAGQLAIHTGC